MKLSETIDSLIPDIEEMMRQNERKSAVILEFHELLRSLLRHPDCTKNIHNLIEKTITRLEKL